MKKHLNILFLLMCHLIFAQQNAPLKFNSNGEFRILQFTDVHWSSDANFTNKTAETIRNLIRKEKPDLIVFTGDNVNRIPMKTGWEDLAKVVEAEKTPWTLVFGNHDEEQDLSKLQSFEILKTFPHFIGEKGNVHGVINYSLPIFGQDGENPAAILYLLDSNDYTRNPKLGSYDWIKSDQVEWYIDESKMYQKRYGHKIPSMMFFHIPLAEHALAAKDKGVIGDMKDDVSSSEINSGLFAAILERRDVMAVFTGHDHDNNYVGTYKGIALGYGSKTGSDGYGTLKQGGRLIILKENKFAFKTYITTPKFTKYLYNFPSGLTEIESTTKVEKAVKEIPKFRNLEYTYYEGLIKSVNEIPSLKPIKTGISSKIDLSPAVVEDHFAILYSGYIKIPQTAYYKFYTYSDDGSVLKIDNNIVVSNDGGHSAQRREGVIPLEEGFHKFELSYFEDYMGQILEVGFSSINLPEQKITEEYLYH